MFCSTVSKFLAKGECCVCGDDDRFRMRCGHYICQSDILENASYQVKSRKDRITCAQCDQTIDLDDFVKVGVRNDEDKRILTQELTMNFLNTQDVKQCPSCNAYLERESTRTNRIECPICARSGKRFFFCWTCLGVWKSSARSKSCGRKNCGIRNIKQLKNPPMKVFHTTSYLGIETRAPLYRACPGCFTIIEHKGGCNAMTCKKCLRRFCFICLRNMTGPGKLCKTTSWEGKMKCRAAPIQNLDKLMA